MDGTNHTVYKCRIIKRSKITLLNELSNFATTLLLCTYKQCDLRKGIASKRLPVYPLVFKKWAG